MLKVRVTRQLVAKSSTKNMKSTLEYPMLVTQILFFICVLTSGYNIVLWLFKVIKSLINKHSEKTDLPSSSEEAVSFLLSCRGENAYRRVKIVLFQFPKNKRPFHRILKLNAECHQQDIKHHFKIMALLTHPDKNKHEEAAEAFKILFGAFELISERVSS